MTILRTFAVLFLCIASSGASAGPRLDAIKARGALHCGVAVAEPGMSQQVVFRQLPDKRPDASSCGGSVCS
jgi:hypothetical protein